MMIKKLMILMTSLVLLVAAAGQGAFAMGGSGTPEELARQYAEYMELYLPGIGEDVRNELKQYVYDGCDAGDIETMALMAAYANLRKAGQVAEAADRQVSGIAPETDVVNEYYTLTDEQKTAFANYLTASLTGIGLSAAVEDGKITVTNGGTELAVITLVTEKPKSVTRMYLDAYLPGLSEEALQALDTLVGEYTGGPAGSGAAWRVIREIGVLMGMEVTSHVDMNVGTVTLTVDKAGEPYFLNLSADVQSAVIAKAQEGLTAIGAEGSYTNGVFTIVKDGNIRLSYAFHTAPAKPTNAAATTAAGSAAAGAATAAAPAPATGEAGSLLWLAIPAVLLLAFAARRRAAVR